MKNKILISPARLIITGLILFFVVSCKDKINTVQPGSSAHLPTLTTTAVIISGNTATSGGVIASDGGAEIIAKGVCFNMAPNPTIENNKVTAGIGSGSFTASIFGLNSNATYYVRAYAVNVLGIAYGNEVVFTATSGPGVPSVSTTSISSITQSSASSGGFVSNNGGSGITERGICYSTTVNPTIISGIKVLGGSGTGSFVCGISGLTPGTTYYVRAYAINSLGTSYGNQVSFTTDISISTPGSGVSDVEGNNYQTLIIGTQEWMKENLRTTLYQDSTAISIVTNGTTWSNLSTPAYCWYNNDPSTYKNTYGALYNWYAINTGNLCPTGWHVPSDVEWNLLYSYLGGNATVLDGLKEAGTAHWSSPNTGATNEANFSALPGGQRSYSDGSFMQVSYVGIFWTSGSVNATNSPCLVFNYSTGSYFTDQPKDAGFSVRCIKD